jgi:antitoxin component YwqK of YwqJK toxin-antitoxin module
LILLSCDKEKTDTKTVFYEDGKTVKQSIEYKNGHKNGAFKEFFPTGKLKAIQHFVNDTLTDSTIIYQANGQLSAIQIFDMGIRQKCWKKYNKAGQVYWQTCFDDGLVDGEATEYSYRSLKLIRRSNYHKGIKHGKQETYYSNGLPESVSYFNNGEPLRGTREWTDTGKEIDLSFKIFVEERNTVQLDNYLRFFIRPENQQEDDYVYEFNPNEADSVLEISYKLPREGKFYKKEFLVPPGSFIMRDIGFAVRRKTGRGNIVVMRKTIAAAVNHY